MTEPYVGEIQIFGFSFAPANWALAAGQLVPIRQSTTLYSLYGTIFGGDGVTTFGLPNFASRMGCSAGQSPGNSRRSLGQTFGSANIALTAAELPLHNHVFSDYVPDDTSQLVAIPVATAAIGTTTGSTQPYAPVGQGATTMNPNAIGVSGNGNPHENRQPFLGMTYAVALLGSYPYFD